MRSGRWLVAGCLGALAVSWSGVVAWSCLTMGGLVALDDDAVPPARSGLAVMGARVYATEGCVNCHTQQVRAFDLAGSDAKLRRTVSRDYLRDPVAFPGLWRIGPDLANFGQRVTGENDIHRFLYGSHRPAPRDLYRSRRISGQPAEDAVSGLAGKTAPLAGWEIVPTDEARALAAYLLSLRQDYPLPEAPKPAKP